MKNPTKQSAQIISSRLSHSSVLRPEVAAKAVTCSLRWVFRFQSCIFPNAAGLLHGPHYNTKVSGAQLQASHRGRFRCRWDARATPSAPSSAACPVNCRPVWKGREGSGSRTTWRRIRAWLCVSRWMDANSQRQCFPLLFLMFRL